MCKWGNYKYLKINNKLRAIDECLFDFVKLLNDNGYKTVACCCGHGKQPSRISLENKKEILFFDFDTAQEISQLFPPINKDFGFWHREALKVKFKFNKLKNQIDKMIKK